MNSRIHFVIRHVFQAFSLEKLLVGVGKWEAKWVILSRSAWPKMDEAYLTDKHWVCRRIFLFFPLFLLPAPLGGIIGNASIWVAVISLILITFQDDSIGKWKCSIRLCHWRLSLFWNSFPSLFLHGGSSYFINEPLYNTWPKRWERSRLIARSNDNEFS